MLQKSCACLAPPQLLDLDTDAHELQAEDHIHKAESEERAKARLHSENEVCNEHSSVPHKVLGHPQGTAEGPPV